MPLLEDQLLDNANRQVGLAPADALPMSSSPQRPNRYCPQTCRRAMRAGNNAHVSRQNRFKVRGSQVFVTVLGIAGAASKV